ncbi:MAG TPA: VCBS repeat-containing protein [Candidatus Limnocylindrales bacterium]|nr:VCBS repeat-containing protein [Candidatus Limnocylindrales bacterium]
MLAATLPANARGAESFRLPFAVGQSWCVYQGYNSGTHTGIGRYSLDLVIGSGCAAVGSQGQQIVSPRSGVVNRVWYISGLPEGICVDFDGGSVKLGHVNWTGRAYGGMPVAAGTVLGTVRDAHSGDNQSGVEHLHIEVYSVGGCPNAVGQPFAGAFTFACSPPLPDLGAATNQHRFTVLTNRGTCASHDYTGDSRPDLLAISDADGKLRLYAGNGAGGLTAPVELGGGWAAYNAIAGGADYNGDGRNDLLAISDTDGKLRLYPGNGAGGLGAPTELGGGWATYDAITGGADYNGDGRADLLAISETDGKLRLYPGNGVGLGAPTVLGGGWSVYNAIAGGADYTGDGRADLLAVSDADGKLRLYPGNGVGLGAPTVLGGGWAVYDAIAGGADYTGDGKADLLGISETDGKLRLYPGNGAGGLGVPIVLGGGWAVYNAIT